MFSARVSGVQSDTHSENTHFYYLTDGSANTRTDNQQPPPPDDDVFGDYLPGDMCVAFDEDVTVPTTPTTPGRCDSGYGLSPPGQRTAHPPPLMLSDGDPPPPLPESYTSSSDVGTQTPSASSGGTHFSFDFVGEGAAADVTAGHWSSASLPIFGDVQHPSQSGSMSPPSSAPPFVSTSLPDVVPSQQRRRMAGIRDGARSLALIADRFERDMSQRRRGEDVWNWRRWLDVLPLFPRNIDLVQDEEVQEEPEEVLPAVAPLQRSESLGMLNI